MVFRRLDLEARRVRLCLLGQGKSVRGLLYEGGMPCVGDFEEEPDFAVQVVAPEFGGVEGVRPWWRPVDHVLLCDLEPAGRHQGLGITTAGVLLLEELVDVLHGVRRDVVAQDEDGVAYFDDSPVEMKVRVFQRQALPPGGCGGFQDHVGRRVHQGPPQGVEAASVVPVRDLSDQRLEGDQGSSHRDEEEETR